MELDIGEIILDDEFDFGEIVLDSFFANPPLQEKTVEPKAYEIKVTADEGVYGLSKVTVNGVKLQDKSITPTTSEQVVNCDDEFAGLGNVTVNSIITQKQRIMPTKKEQVIIPEDGKFFSEVTVDGDGALIPENIAKGRSIFGVEGTANLDLGWQPEPDWWDIKTILQEDNTINPATGEPYKAKFAILQMDTTQNADIRGLKYIKADAIRFSDGAFYTEQEPFIHKWDLSKDKPCSKGYSTRYIIVYLQEDIDIINSVGWHPLQSYFYDLYWVFDTNIYGRTHSATLSSGTVKCIEFINDKKFYVGKKPSFNNNYMVEEYRMEMVLESPISGESLFVNNASCKKFPKIINPNNITAVNSFYSGCKSVEEINGDDWSNTTNLNNVIYYCRNLCKLKNIKFPESYVSYANFANETRVNEITTLNTMKTTSLYNAFYSCGIEKLDIDIDTSQCTNFSYFCAFCYGLKEIVPVLDFSACTTAPSSIFANCYKLEVVWIKNLGKSFGNSNYMYYLRQDCLEYLIDNLQDLTGQTSQTLTFAYAVKQRLTDELKEKAINKNWTIK